MLYFKGFHMFKFIIYFLVFLVATGCTSSDNTDRTPSVTGNISDNLDWYDDEATLKTVYTSYSIPNSQLCAPWQDTSAALRACTLDDINHDLDPDDSYEPYLDVILTSDEFHSSTENAKFKIRGNYTRFSDQKSYAIKLYSKDNLLDSTRKFNLNKHQSDRSRVKNKLAMDLIKDIPNITSNKTQFYQLYLNSESYGLFTHVEALSEEYMIHRGWNTDDNLYNINNFTFDSTHGLEVDQDGKPLDEVAFNLQVEIKNGKDHRKFVEVVEAINSNTPIDTIIAKYFNRDNYLKWLAIQIILGNKDTYYHNYALYNPKYSDTFYFIPWDYDGAWSKAENLGKYEYSIGVWWPVPLHKKFLSIKKNFDDLNTTIYDLRENYFSDAKIQGLLDSYSLLIENFMGEVPDNENNSNSTWNEAINDLIPLISNNNIKLYEDEIGNPMPFEVYYDDSLKTISWDESIDLEGDEIVYDLKIASYFDMNNSLVTEENLTTLSYTLDTLSTNTLAPGIYYAQIISKEKYNPENYQIAYIYRKKDADGNRYYGIFEFEVR